MPKSNRRPTEPAALRGVRRVEQTLRRGMPGGDVRLTYLDNPEIRDGDGNRLNMKGLHVLKAKYRLPGAACFSAYRVIVPVPVDALREPRYTRDVVALVSSALARHLEQRAAAVDAGKPA